MERSDHKSVEGVRQYERTIALQNLNVCRVLEQKPEGQANQFAITPALPPAPLQRPLAVPRMQGAITPAVPPPIQGAITPAVPSAPSQWPLAVPAIQGASRPMAFQGCTFSNCTFQVVNYTTATGNYTEDLPNIN